MTSASSLRTRVVLTALIAVIPAIATIVYTQTVERTRLYDRARDETLHLTRVAASRETSILDGTWRLLLTMQQFPAIRGTDGAACDRLLDNILGDHKGYQSIAVINPDGTVFAVAPRVPGLRSARERTWFQRAMQTRELAVSDYQVSRITGKPDLMIALPLLDSSGAVERVIGVGVQLERLSDVASALTFPPGTTLTIFDRSGTVLARHPDPARWVGRPLADSALVARLVASGPEEIVETKGVDGTSRLYATVQIEPELNTRLFVGVGTDPRMAYAELGWLRTRDAVVLALVSALVFLIALATGDRFVLQPVRALVETTERLAAGNFAARAPKSGGAREIRELSQAINKMASAIEQRQQERDRVEQQLREAQKMEAVGRLAGGIAHDFNNLLTVIIGGSDLLREDLPPDSPAQTLVNDVRKAASRAAQLTRQLLAYSRRQTLDIRAVSLHELIGELGSMLRRLLPTSVTVEIEEEPVLPLVRIDRGQFEQVIMNLVVNAADAMPAGGTLTLRTSTAALTELDRARDPDVVPGSYVRLTVSDTGVGMDAQTVARAFEPFFTTKAVGKGTGLGLSTAYGIVKQSGGFIWVDSMPGKGTTFAIHLPAHGFTNRTRHAAAAIDLT